METFPFIKHMEARVFTLMHTESEIIGQTMVNLATKSGIPTFPVHDCLMCRVEDVDQVLAELVATTNGILGAPISLDVTYPDRPTEYYKAEGSLLVRCDKTGDVRHFKHSWQVSDDSDFDVVED